MFLLRMFMIGVGVLLSIAPSTLLNAQLDLPPNAIIAMQWNADGSLLAIGRLNGMVEIIDGTTFDVLLTIQANPSGPITELAWNPDLQMPYLATGGTGGVVRVWDVATGANVAILGGAEPLSGSITGISWNTTGDQIMGFANQGQVVLWDVMSDTVIFETSEFAPSLNAGAWSKDGAYYAVASTSGAIAIADAVAPDQGNILHYLDEDISTTVDMVWSPDPETPHMLASIGFPYPIQLWDASTGTRIRVSSQWINDPIMVAFSPDGSTIALASVWGVGVVFDVDSLTYIDSFELGTVPVFAWQSNDTISFFDSENQLSFYQVPSDWLHAVNSFTLIDADTDQPVPGYNPIPVTIDAPEPEVVDIVLPEGVTSITIEANVGGTVESVVFGLNDTPSYWTENGAPWVLTGINGGDYIPWNFTSDQPYTLTATPYSADDGAGTAGTPLTLMFTIRSE